MAAPPPNVPSVLLTEILGFSPQLLLDDIVNCANDAVLKAVEAMEAHFVNEYERRSLNLSPEEGEKWDQEIEQGLVAFQTLLDSHMDIAFDFFEAWSLRNIFAVQADLPVVVPHQEGLDVNYAPQREGELLAEVEELRRQIQNMRRLERLYTLAVRRSALQLRRSERRLQKLSFLRSTPLQTLSDLPALYSTLYTTTSSLPPSTDSTSSDLARMDAGKRRWEGSKNGYFSWAVERLVSRQRGRGTGGRGAIMDVARRAEEVGRPVEIKGVLEGQGEEGEDRMEVDDEGQGSEGS